MIILTSNLMQNFSNHLIRDVYHVAVLLIYTTDCLIYCPCTRIYEQMHVVCHVAALLSTTRWLRYCPCLYTYLWPYIFITFYTIIFLKFRDCEYVPGHTIINFGQYMYGNGHMRTVRLIKSRSYYTSVKM